MDNPEAWADASSSAGTHAARGLSSDEEPPGLSSDEDGVPLPAPHLPVDVLRMVLLRLLELEQPDGEVPDQHMVLSVYAPFSAVNRSFLEAARTTPLRLSVAGSRALPRAVRVWLCRNTIRELYLHTDFPSERCICNPGFLERSAPVLQRLWGVQVPFHRYRQLPLRHFTALRALELNADMCALNDNRPQGFDARQLAALTQLTQLSLQQFETVDNLGRLPAGLQVLSLLVFRMDRVELPRHLRSLREVTLSARELSVNLWALCTQVTEKLTLEAPTIGVLVSERAAAAAATFWPEADVPVPPLLQAAAPEAPAAPEPAGQLVAVDLAPEQAAAQADALQLAMRVSAPQVVATAMRAGRVQWVELFSQRLDALTDPGGVEFHSCDMIELAQDLQLNCLQEFGCFFDPENVEDDEELDLWEGLHVELVRHEPGKPQAIGITYDLHEVQEQYLLSPGTQVYRLAMEVVPPHIVALVVGSDAFFQASGATLRQLQGPDITSALQLPRFEQLEELDAFLPNSVDLLEHMPRSLLRLFLCAVATEPELGPEGEPVDGPVRWPRFSAAGLAARCPGLQNLSLSHFSEADLADLPPSVTSILLENLQPGPPEPPRGLRPVRFALPPLAPGGQRLLKLQFMPSLDMGEGMKRLVVDLEQLLANTEAGVYTSSPLLPSDEELDPGVATPGPVTLTVRAAQHSLAGVMAAVTASPLQYICFSARKVVFLGAGGAVASSRQLQRFIREQCGHAWRLSPLDVPEGYEHHLDDEQEEDQAGEAGGEEHFESFALRRVGSPLPLGLRADMVLQSRMHM